MHFVLVEYVVDDGCALNDVRSNTWSCLRRWSHG